MQKAPKFKNFQDRFHRPVGELGTTKNILSCCRGRMWGLRPTVQFDSSEVHDLCVGSMLCLYVTTEIEIRNQKYDMVVIKILQRKVESF